VDERALTVRLNRRSPLRDLLVQGPDVPWGHVLWEQRPELLLHDLPTPTRISEVGVGPEMCGVADIIVYESADRVFVEDLLPSYLLTLYKVYALALLLTLLPPPFMCL
jgi:hypothetical protein